MNYLLSSSFVFWLTIGLILGENLAYAAVSLINKKKNVKLQT